MIQKLILLIKLCGLWGQNTGLWSSRALLASQVGALAVVWAEPSPYPRSMGDQITWELVQPLPSPKVFISDESQAPPLSKGEDLQESKWCSLRGVNPLYVNLKDQLEFPEFTPSMCPSTHRERDCGKHCEWTQNKTRLTWLRVSLWTSGFLELVTSCCFEMLGWEEGLASQLNANVNLGHWQASPLTSHRTLAPLGPHSLYGPPLSFSLSRGC